LPHYIVVLGSNKVDRLSVLVFADVKDKLLGVPKLVSGTGVNALYYVLTEWGLGNKIVYITSINTGLKNGACVLLEHKIEEELLWIACRHHIL